ncbi:MAG TPA: type VI secretion system tube protein Hcp [Rhodopila sp.]|uniref:type VI secretion system tube protein Hcp n=1 Tax=Rhodopila sp. TaxID=2480087 RepID=UPI002B5382B8|nr:type VI secretion system tube protein Hcp [Rhodopila sp.]HVY16441.1 type VI secretion system tube protein Hcp [Rhodopila sp.]
MAESAPKTDTVMKFEFEKKPVYAECTLSVASGDSLMDGFRPGVAGVKSSYSNFFEVHDSNFSMSLKEDDSMKTSGDAGPFASWRSATDEEAEKIKYPFEFDKFSFKRTVDQASPLFFYNCCNSITFDSATVVKRLNQGGDRPSMGIMRIDFYTVLLTGVDWTDGELIQESCEFICQKMKITLRRQGANGVISAAGEVVMTWDGGPENIRDKYAPR